MDMDNLGLQLLGTNDCLESMDNSFERFAARCVDIDEFDTLPVGKVVMAIAGAADDGNVISLSHQTGEEFLAVRFDTTHDVGDATRAGNNYAVLLFLHERFGFRSP